LGSRDVFNAVVSGDDCGYKWGIAEEVRTMLLPFREHLDFGPTPYDQLQAKERIPVIRGNVVSDVMELELRRWERMGVAGCYLNLAEQQQTDAYVCEIPPQPNFAA
jgi:hypothetical protein